MADSIGEGSSMKDHPSSTRSVFDAPKASALFDLTSKMSVHCNPPPKRRARSEGSTTRE